MTPEVFAREAVDGRLVRYCMLKSCRGRRNEYINNSDWNDVCELVWDTVVQRLLDAGEGLPPGDPESFRAECRELAFDLFEEALKENTAAAKRHQSET